MKLSFKNINKTSFIISLIIHLMAFKAHALDSVAIVNDIQGIVFVSIKGKTIQLKLGDEIILGSEILTTASGTVSITDYYDHQFHLSNSTHIKLQGEIVQLKRGYLWMQSYRKNDKTTDFKLMTANAITKYNYGESIFSFDPETTKSQLLVIKGKFEFLNIENDMDRTTVEDGQFSYIKTDQEAGSPRAPTPVGFTSFKKITGLFNKISPMGSTDHIVMRGIPVAKAKNGKPTPSWKKQKINKRSIASVPSKSGNIIYVHSAEKGAVFLKNQLNRLGRKYKRKKKKVALKKTDVTVRVYGADFKINRVPASVKSNKPKAKKKVETPAVFLKKSLVKKSFNTSRVQSKRAPASISKQPIVIKKETDAFEKGLGDAYKKQMRHSPEMNSLIKDLKNYDQDFKTAY